jgi:hypothetical protein
MQTDEFLKVKYESLLPHLREKEKRLVLAADVQSMGRGGLSEVSKITGVSRVTLNAGIDDLKSAPLGPGSKKSRKQGGGRKKKTEKDDGLVCVIEQIVEPHTLGDPMKK